MSESRLRLERTSDAGYLNVRCNPANEDLLSVIAEQAGVSMPLAANTVEATSRRAYWLGPDEWLLAIAPGDTLALKATLDDALQGAHVAINDVSGGLVTYLLRGEQARELLAKGCTLDLHPDVLKKGSCAQTGLAKANVILSLSEDADGFDIIVRRSFADYVWQWLSHAGRNLGIEVA